MVEVTTVHGVSGGGQSIFRTHSVHCKILRHRSVSDECRGGFVRIPHPKTLGGTGGIGTCVQGPKAPMFSFFNTSSSPPLTLKVHTTSLHDLSYITRGHWHLRGLPVSDDVRGVSGPQEEEGVEVWETGVVSAAAVAPSESVSSDTPGRF